MASTDDFDDIQPDKHLRALILEVLDNQLRDNDPKETKETYRRLLKLGIPEQEVRRLLAVVIASEMFDIMKQNTPFDRGRFVQRLNLLPETPWMEGGE